MPRLLNRTAVQLLKFVSETLHIASAKLKIIESSTQKFGHWTWQLPVSRAIEISEERGTQLEAEGIRASTLTATHP